MLIKHIKRSQTSLCLNDGFIVKSIKECAMCFYKVIAIQSNALTHLLPIEH